MSIPRHPPDFYGFFMGRFFCWEGNFVGGVTKNRPSGYFLLLYATLANKKLPLIRSSALKPYTRGKVRFTRKYSAYGTKKRIPI